MDTARVRRMGARRRSIVVVGVLATLLAGVPAASTATAAAACPLGLTASAHTVLPDGTGFTVCSGRLPSFDGTPLDVDVTVPDAASSPLALVVMLSGFATAKTDWESTSVDGNGANSWHWNNAWFADRGYAVLTYSARGFFKSCGRDPSGYTYTTDPQCAGRASWTHLADRRWEIHDAQWLSGLLVDAQVARPDRIVATGESYGGGESWLLAMAGDQVTEPDGTLTAWTSPHGVPMHLAAAIPQFGWTDLAHGLLDNGRDVGDDPVGVEKDSYLNALFTLGGAAGQYATTADPSADVPDWVTAFNQGEPYAANPTVATAVAQMQTWRSAYYLPVPTQRPVPVFAVQGLTDPLFPGSQVTAMLDKLRAANYPVTAFFGDLGHSYADNSPATWTPANDTANAWLAQVLAGQPTTAAPVTWTTAPCGQSMQTFSGGSVAALSTGSWQFSHPQTVATTNTGTAGPEAAALDPVANHGCRTYSGPTDPGVTSVGFTPPAAATIVGAPAVHADATLTGTDAELAFRLFDVSPDGSSRTLITRAVYRLLGSSGQTSPVDLDLWPTGWRVQAGHTLALEVTQVDNPTWRADNEPSSVTLTGLQLSVPITNA